MAVDVAGGHGQVFVTGEVTSAATEIDVEAIVQRIAGDIDVAVHIAKQSPEIAQGVDAGGAGDQGIMVGFATNETKEFLPLEYVLARSLNQSLYNVWPNDGKTQITITEGAIVTAVASFQHASKNELTAAVNKWLAEQEIAPVASDVQLHINPAGDWDMGGFDADAGLTGRKLVVDNYGPRIPIGGGAFSGKDPSKVDRSAAYMARKIAVEYLQSRNAHEVYVYLAYAIGFNQPLEATVRIDGVQEVVTGYNLSPDGIIAALDLKRPMYENTAKYGHFGHVGLPWEA